MQPPRNSLAHGCARCLSANGWCTGSHSRRLRTAIPLARNLAGYRELCARDARRQQLRSAIDVFRGLLPGEIEHMRRIAASYRANGEHPEQIARVLRQTVTIRNLLAEAEGSLRLGIYPVVSLGRSGGFRLVASGAIPRRDGGREPRDGIATV